MQQNPDYRSASTSVTAAAVIPRPKGNQQMLDCVKVAPDTFKMIMFMGSAEKKEFTRDNMPARDKPQKRTSSGVPLWSVQVCGVDWRDNSKLFPVTVPMHEDPADSFAPGSPIILDGLVFGITPRQAGGFVQWCSADSLAPITSAARASA